MFYFKINFLLYILIFLEIVFVADGVCITTLLLMTLLLRVQRVARYGQPRVPLVHYLGCKWSPRGSE